MNSPLSNDQIIEKLKHAAAVLEVTDTSPQKVFKVRAYQTAIESLENLDEEISHLVAEGKIDDIQGIGKELAQKITDLVTTGTSKSLDQLYAQVPPGMFPLLEIPGLGPKKAYKLSSHFKLNDSLKALNTLKKHAQKGDIAPLENFGEKSQQKILLALDSFKPKSSRMLISEAQRLAQKVIDRLQKYPEVHQVEALGSLRRHADTIGDVDIGVAAESPADVIKQLKTGKDYSVQVAGQNVIRLIFPGNRQVDIKFQTPDKWGATLQHFTGSKAHNIALRELALKQDKSLSEHGIKHQGKLHTFKNETDFYAYIGLPLIDPRLRENSGELEAAQKKRLPAVLKVSDIKGETHCHTDFSMKSSHDYGMSIKDLLDAASALAYEWVMIGDHNPSQQTFPGNKMSTILKQRNDYIEQQYYTWKENSEKRDINIYKSMEVDILPDGSLAVPDSALGLLDLVIVSIHSRFDLPKPAQTERLLKALSHPKVKILGHPTGRLLNQRPPIAVDWPKIFNLCRQNHIALEINANPRRLDLPDSLVRQAINAQVKLSLGTDAHQASSFNDIEYGVNVAARGWSTKRDIINTYSYKELYQWINQ